MKHLYNSNLNELKKLAADVKAFSNAHNIHKDVHYALNLCLDEVLTNIISYGMKDKQEGEPFIELELKKNKSYIQATMSDNGIPYDPLNKQNLNPNTKSPIEERKVGGLGIYFLDQYMDNIQYQHLDNLNVLTLTKNL